MAKYRLEGLSLVACCLALGIAYASGSEATREASRGTDEAIGQPTEAEGSDTAPDYRPLPYSQRWYGQSVMYEIMVRSFQDSNGDGIGDLRGVISRLDYLNSGKPNTTSDLKIDAIWLMPIFQSPSYHGYDTTDYTRIDPAYGTLEDFKALIEAAHARGVRVLLDLVLNHTSNQHPWFQAAKGAKSDKRDWYVWSSAKLDWIQPWGANPVWHKQGRDYYYGLFWDGMPDLNYNNPEVGDEMIRIGRYWLEQGADGYRLDAIRYLYEEGAGKQSDLPATHAYLKRFAAEMRKVRPDVCLVGEIWSQTGQVAPYYGQGDELDLAFGFDESGAIRSVLQDFDPEPLIRVLDAVAATYPERAFSAPFLTNHDMDRLATLLGNDRNRLKLAASILLSLPGTPFLYQGEEIGLFNGKTPGDPGKRTPMQWDGGPTAGFTSSSTPWIALSGQQEKISVKAQTDDPGSLLNHYRFLLRMRRDSPALRHGQIVGTARGASRTLFFQRVAKGEVVVCAFNLGNSVASLGEIPVDKDALRMGEFEGAPTSAVDLRTGKPLTLDGGRISLPDLDPRQAIWVRVR